MRERKDCRLCGSPVTLVFSLTPTPIANDYKLEPDSEADCYPLELTQCSCGHVQQRYVIDGMFEDYKYTTPKTVARYLDPVAKLLKERFPKAVSVFEIGSNNGTYLEVLRENGFSAIGIDPAAQGKGNYKAYFTERWAIGHAVDQGEYDLVVANNVLAHIDGLEDVFWGIATLLKNDGAVVFEVQYLQDLVESASFDMIYHEHMSYHTIEPLKPFLKQFGLIITHIDHLPLHGGSIRVTAQRRGEEVECIENPIDWNKFSMDVENIRQKVRAKLKDKKVIVFGAAAKATTLIHHCGIQENILYCVDDTPEKQYRYIPGTDIQILPTSEAKDGDTIFMCAWNYEKEIREKYPNSELIHPFK